MGSSAAGGVLVVGFRPTNHLFHKINPTQNPIAKIVFTTPTPFGPMAHFYFSLFHY
jgi:hypothetical protein